MPHTVKIKSKDFLDYVSEKNRNISMYFENKHDIYINMPNEIEGEIIKRKDYVDFMDFSPACLSLKAVVSAKVKNVLEQIHVRKSEYILKRIKIDGIASDFYLLFVPIIKEVLHWELDTLAMLPLMGFSIWAITDGTIACFFAIIQFILLGIFNLFTVGLSLAVYSFIQHKCKIRSKDINQFCL